MDFSAVKKYRNRDSKLLPNIFDKKKFDKIMVSEYLL